MDSSLRTAFEAEMTAAKRCMAGGRLDAAMGHLERAHVLGQRAVGPHVRTHWRMLQIAFRQRAIAGCAGQAARIALGALGSAVGVVPAGNTGGTDISMFARLPVDPELARLLAGGRQRDRSGD
jgi:hypothetical protein